MGEKSCLVDDLRTAVYETRTYGGVRGAFRHLMAEPSTRLCFRALFSFRFSALGQTYSLTSFGFCGWLLSDLAMCMDGLGWLIIRLLIL